MDRSIDRSIWFLSRDDDDDDDHSNNNNNNKRDGYTISKHSLAVKNVDVSGS
jgi:hypothetical protein